MLLLHANEVVSSDRLIDELWAGEGREEAGRALQVAVSRLRRALEPGRATRREETGIVVTRAPGYELRTDPARLDVKRFEALVNEGRRALAAGDARSARAKLDQALALWRGPPLADLAYESFCQTEIARLEALRLGALEERIDADLALGRHADVVAQLEGLIDEYPLRERLRAQLMLALYRSRPPGRGARGLPRHAAHPRRGARDRARARAAGARAGDTEAGRFARPVRNGRARDRAHGRGRARRLRRP